MLNIKFVPPLNMEIWNMKYEFSFVIFGFLCNVLRLFKELQEVFFQLFPVWLHADVVDDRRYNVWSDQVEEEDVLRPGDEDNTSANELSKPDNDVELAGHQVLPDPSLNFRNKMWENHLILVFLSISESPRTVASWVFLNL